MSDWAEHKDPGTGRSYYYNAKTGVTSWERPAEMGAPAAAADASGWTAVKDASGKTYYYNAATGATSWDAPAGFSAAGGDGSAGARKDKVLAKRGAIAKKKAAQPQTVGEKLAARAKKFVSLRKAEKAKSQPSAFARKRTGAIAIKAAPAAAAAAGGGAAAAPALAAGSPWQAVKHPETGQTYYYNATTGETSWTLPA